MRGIEIVPMVCTACREIVSVERAPNPRCPECRGQTLREWEHQPDESEYEAPCPDCERPASVRSTGIWD